MRKGMGTTMSQVDLVVRWGMVACVVLQLSGCGKTEDSDSGAKGGSDDGSKPLDDLSDVKVRDVCEEVSAPYEGGIAAYERGVCILESVELTGNGALCDEAVEECIDLLKIEITSVDECVELLDFTGCEATVDELNECVAATRQRVEQISALRSCDDAADSEVTPDTWLDDVPACTRLANKCPDLFDRETGGTGGTGGTDGTGGIGGTGGTGSGETPHVIEGTVDGEAVEIRPGNSLSSSYSATGGLWSAGLAFGGASLWLWGDAESGQGLMRMPASSSEEQDWLCLDEVEVQRGTEISTWQSSSLSALPVACDGDTQPFELSFTTGYAVTGALQGEAIDWISSGFSCSSGLCSFRFQPSDSTGYGQDVWILEIDTAVEVGAINEFGHATLIHPGGTAAVACGGGGTLTWSTDDEIRIVVDALGALAECPGKAIDGELSGAF